MPSSNIERSFIQPTGASALAITVVALPAFLLGAFGPSIKEDLGFGDTTLGAIFTLGYFMSAVGMLIGGQFADISGPRTVMRAGIATSGIASVLFGAVTASLPVLVMVVVISRIGESVVHPASNALISQGVPSHRQGLAIGLKQAAVPLATALAGFSVPMLGAELDWEGTFFVVAALAIPAWVLIPAVGKPSSRKGQTTADVWRLPHMRIVALAGGLGAASVVTVAGFLTTAAEDAGYSKGTSGLLLTLGGFIMVVGRSAWGAIADRFEFDRFFATGCSIAAGSIGYLMLATQAKLPIFIGVLIIFSLGWSWPGLLILGVVERHPNEVGAASAVHQMGVRLGAIPAPILFGLVADSAGFRMAWYVPFASAVISALLLIIASRVYPDSKSNRSSNQ